MKCKAGRTGHWIAGVLGCTLAVVAAAPAQAGDAGFRLEVGPEVSYTRNSTDFVRSWQAGAAIGVEAWGLGPIGGMLHVSEGLSFSDVTISAEGLTPTLTYVTRVDIGPTVNLTPGPVHLRFGAGPWFGFSRVSEESVANMSAGDVALDWTQATFMGVLGEARLDLNLPIISPFVIMQGRSQAATSVEGGTDSSREGYQGIDFQGSAGFRLNLLPFVKLGVAGHAGFSPGGAMPVLSTDNAVRYGGSLWLVVLI